MITSQREAVNEMLTHLRDAWLSNPATQEWDLVWGNVAHDFKGNTDAHGNPIPWLYVQCLHEDSSKLSIKSKGARIQHRGSILAHLHMPEGMGINSGRDEIASVGAAFTGIDTPNGVWFRSPNYADIGPDGTWYVLGVTIPFLYDLIQ